jgi:large subunit ribosomal protein L24
MIRKKKLVYEAKMRIKKNDEVVVLSGKDKGKKAKVLETLPDAGKVRLEGLNMATRHRKPGGQSNRNRAMMNEQLGEMKFPAAMPVGKVMLICPRCNHETRVKGAKDQEGKPARMCGKCKELIDA